MLYIITLSRKKNVNEGSSLEKEVPRWNTYLLSMEDVNCRKTGTAKKLLTAPVCWPMLGFVSQTKIFNDFSKTIPSAAISPEPRKGYWRVCEYTCGDIKGKLLHTDSKGDTPTLTLPLNLKGWHRVKIGVWGTDYHSTYAPSGNRVKLSGDACFKSFERDRMPPVDSISIEDFEFTCADLTGKDLLIAPPARGSSATTALAYVRCESLSTREVEELQADRRNTDCRKTIAYNDGWSYIFSREYRDKEDIWELVEWYRYSDMESLYWGLIGTVTTFPVKTGRMMTGYDGEAFETLNKKGINSLTTAMEYAQGMGERRKCITRAGFLRRSSGSATMPFSRPWL